MRGRRHSDGTVVRQATRRGGSGADWEEPTTIEEVPWWIASSACFPCVEPLRRTKSVARPDMPVHEIRLALAHQLPKVTFVTAKITGASHSQAVKSRNRPPRVGWNHAIAPGWFRGPDMAGLSGLPNAPSTRFQVCRMRRARPGCRTARALRRLLPEVDRPRCGGVPSNDVPGFRRDPPDPGGSQP